MENERIVEETREAVLKIDQAIADTVQANEEETLLTAKLDSLRKVVSKRQQKIEEMGEWAKLVIDKTNRAVAGKMLSTKEQ